MTQQLEGSEQEFLLDFEYIIGYFMAPLIDCGIIYFIFSVTVFDWLSSGTAGHSVQLCHLSSAWLWVCVCVCGQHSPNLAKEIGQDPV